MYDSIEPFESKWKIWRAFKQKARYIELKRVEEEMRSGVTAEV